MDKPSIETRCDQDNRSTSRKWSFRNGPRVLRWCEVIAVVGAIYVMIGVDQWPHSRRLVEAEELLIKGKDGRQRIWMGTDDNGDPIMNMFDAKSEVGIVFSIGSDVFEPGKKAATISFSSNVPGRLILGVAGDGHPYVHLQDRGMRTQVIVGTSSSGNFVVVHDQSGHPMVSMGVDPEGGKPSVVVRDKGGKILFRAPSVDPTPQKGKEKTPMWESGR